VASKKKGARRADMLAELQRVIPLGIARQQSRLVHFELVRPHSNSVRWL
jgi:hypothetical protein